jgi:hypothetical protein
MVPFRKCTQKTVTNVGIIGTLYVRYSSMGPLAFPTVLTVMTVFYKVFWVRCLIALWRASVSILGVGRARRPVRPRHRS